MDTLDRTDEVTAAAALTEDPEPQTVDDAPKLLIEELTIDGMCGVY
jgi:mycofactocin precursor